MTRIKDKDDEEKEKGFNEQREMDDQSQGLQEGGMEERFFSSWAVSISCCTLEYTLFWGSSRGEKRERDERIDVLLRSMRGRRMSLTSSENVGCTSEIFGPSAPSPSVISLEDDEEDDDDEEGDGEGPERDFLRETVIWTEW